MTGSDRNEAREWAAVALSGGCMPEGEWASCLEYISRRRESDWPESALGAQLAGNCRYEAMTIDAAAPTQRLWSRLRA
jgi:hypothetical protein